MGSNRGYPDIQNLITISEVFNISLDDLMKNDKKLTKKIISDSSSKKWHILLQLLSILRIFILFMKS